MANTTYDIGAALYEVETRLIDGYIKRLKFHLNDEAEAGVSYTEWRVAQLAQLEAYRKETESLYHPIFGRINAELDKAIIESHKFGGTQQEEKILAALKAGWIPSINPNAQITAQFMAVNNRKLNALVRSTVSDMQQAEYAMLRMANDQYRKIIFDAQVYANTGSGTLAQAVDMASRDYLSSGIDCIEYKNGTRVTIDSYARMAVQTANKRAYVIGESEKRDEWGINTVYVSSSGSMCPICAKYAGKVYYDDVYSGLPSPNDGKYPLLSDAIEAGLFHPNCRDSYSTYFPGVTEAPKKLTAKQLKESQESYALEQEQRYNERTIRKYKRLRDGSIDPDNRQKYQAKVTQWQQKNNALIKDNDSVLHRDYTRESAHGIKRLQ